MRKACILLLVIVIFATYSIAAFADNPWLPDVFFDKSVKSPDQFLVKITRPEGDETTTKRSYVVCGNTNQEGIVIQLLRLNSEGLFEPLYNTEGNSSWKIGGSGIFNKEIILNDGANRIRVVAYKKDEMYNLVLGENLQISDFSVTLLSNWRNIMDKIKGWFSF